MKHMLFCHATDSNAPASARRVAGLATRHPVGAEVSASLVVDFIGGFEWPRVRSLVDDNFAAWGSNLSA